METGSERRIVTGSERRIVIESEWKIEQAVSGIIAGRDHSAITGAAREKAAAP